MKSMQKGVSKALAAVIVALAVLPAWAQDNATSVPKVKFSNTLKTTVVHVADGDVDEPDFYDQAKVTVSSEKVFALAKARAVLTRQDKDGGGDWALGDWEGINFKKSKFDWTIKYMPTPDWGLSMHESLFIPGTYIVVDDDNLHGGNIASHGFTVSYKGIPGLTLAASVPFDLSNYGEDEDHNWDRDHKTNYFNAGGNCDGYTFRIGGGAIYELGELFTIGAAVHEIGRDNFSGGAYFTVQPVSNLTVYGGYTYKNQSSYLYDESCINVDHIFNGSAVFQPGKFDFAADFVGSSEGDVYTALRVGYNITDTFYAKVEGLLFTEDVAKGEMGSSGDDKMYRIYPDVIVSLGKWGSLEAGAEVWLESSDFAYVEFPVFWYYNF